VKPLFAVIWHDEELIQVLAKRHGSSPSRRRFAPSTFSTPGAELGSLKRSPVSLGMPLDVRVGVTQSSVRRNPYVDAVVLKCEVMMGRLVTTVRMRLGARTAMAHI
jgi:hypothetical protein